MREAVRTAIASGDPEALARRVRGGAVDDVTLATASAPARSRR
jgi:hypothetical protein